MINKQEENETQEINNFSTTNQLIEEKERIQTLTKQLQNEICTSFKKLIHVLESREKQLLRQVDVLHHQQVAYLQTQQNGVNSKCNDFSISLDLKDEESISQCLSHFGKLNIYGTIFDKEDDFSSLQYINEEEDLTKDHICFSKPLQTQTCQSESVINFNPLNKLTNIEMNPKNVVNEKTKQTEEEKINKAENKIEEQTGQLKEWLDHIKSETETEPSVEEFESSLSTLTI